MRFFGNGVVCALVVGVVYVLGFGTTLVLARPHAPSTVHSTSKRSRLGPPVLNRFQKRAQIARARKGRLRYVWEDLSEGMFSLEVTAVALHPKHRKLAYAGADGILYRTTNAGDTWHPVARFRGGGRALLRRINITPQLRRLKRRIFDEKLEDLISQIGEDQAEKLRSTLEREAEEEADQQLAGARKLGQVTGSGRFRRRIYRIVIPPNQPKWVLVATDAGVFRSTDNGKTFKHIYRGRAPGEGDVRVIRVDPKNSNRIWLGTRVGLWASRNGGQTWRRDGGNMRAFEVREIRFDPSLPSRMFVATNRSVFMSINRGKSFLRLWTFMSGTRRITGLTMMNTTPPKLVVATGNGLYLSSGNFQSFQRLAAGGIGSRQIRYITSINAAPKWLYVINDQGVFVSKNEGRRFRQLREGMLSPTIRWITVRRDDPRELWAATDFGLLRWSKTLAGKITAGQWRSWKRRIGLEPSPWEMARAAQEYMLIPSKLAELQSRNSVRAWMPTVVLRAILTLRKSQDELSLVQGQRPISILEGRTFYFELSLNWPLDRLVLDNQQLNVVAQTRILRRSRQRLMNRVIRLHNARRRLMLRQFVTPPRKLRRYLKKYLKIQELTAYLNALTGNYLRRIRERRGLSRK